MATNNFFASNYESSEEQGLIRSLITEAIQIQGYDIFYMPKESVNYDYLFGEDTHPLYNKAYMVEAYIKDVEGYRGGGQILTKLGLDTQEDMTILISIERFSEEITKDEPKIIRPREGDLIYFGLDKHTIMEITFVDNKPPFFMGGELYTYEISMKRFSYGSQTIETGIPDIDEVENHGAITNIIVGDSITNGLSYIVGELVYQLGSDNTTYKASGTILGFDNNIITMHDVFGVFEEGINIIGETSGAIYAFPVKNDITFDDVSRNKVSDNVKVKIEGDDVIDRSEANPFIDF
jgi:hypothetical protein